MSTDNTEIQNFPTPEELSTSSTLNNALLSTIQAQLTALRAKQDLSAPDINTWMQELNHNIRLNPELIHLLPDEDRAILYQAVIELSKIAIAPPVKVPKPKAEPKGKKAIIKFDSLKPLDNLDFLI